MVEEIRLRIRRPAANSPAISPCCFRTNEQTRQFEMEFRRGEVPYVIVGGMSFYDRKEVRDVLAYVKLLVNPRDEVSLLRVINTPARGIGQATVTRLLEEAVVAGRAVWDVLAYRSAVPAHDSAGGGSEGIREFPRADRDAYREAPEKVAGRRRHARWFDEINYRDELARLYPDAQQQEARWAAVEEVVNAAASYCRKAKQPTLSGFLAEMALASGDDDWQKESQVARNAVTLMTLHAAKGLEFPEVYLVGHGGGATAAPPLDRGDGRRRHRGGRAAALLRRHHPGAAAADADAAAVAAEVGQSPAHASPAAFSTRSPARRTTRTTRPPSAGRGRVA